MNGDKQPVTFVFVNFVKFLNLIIMSQLVIFKRRGLVSISCSPMKMSYFSSSNSDNVSDIECDISSIYNFDHQFTVVTSEMKHNRNRRNLGKQNIEGITKRSIKRLSRRGGVKRISGDIYKQIRIVIRIFLENIIKDAIVYTDYCRRKTVTVLDVIYALKKQQIVLYGLH